MLSLEEIREELADVLYKPGWHFEAYQHREEGIWVAIHVSLENSYRPGQSVDICVRSPLPPIPDTDYLHVWMNWRLDRIDNHERREWYRVRGEIRDDPHADPDGM